MPNIGDFGLVRTNGWMAWAIRFGTHSTVNHAFIYVGNGKIIEAEPGGARISDVSKYSNIIWSTGLVTDPTVGARIARWAEAQVGVPYGWLDIAALTLDAAGIRFAVVDHRIERMDRLICSQLVDKAYRLAGVHLFKDGRLSGEVTPGDLLTVLHALHLGS